MSWSSGKDSASGRGHGGGYVFPYRDVIFGDLFLADVRAYREKALAGSGITPLFPLWGRSTPELACEMIASGVRAILTCVDPAQLDPRYLGCRFDAQLLDELRATVDACGEHGEFHTFVLDAPGFRAPIDVEVGEVVQRDGFVFCDLIPATLHGSDDG